MTPPVENHNGSSHQRENKRRTYSGFFKAKVVKELLNDHKTYYELAEKYDLHPNQIKNWKSFLLKNAEKIFVDRRRK